MTMCPRCHGAVVPGQVACGICGVSLAGGVDPTQVQPGPGGPAWGSTPPPPGAPPYGSTPAPYGSSPAPYGYGAPPGYGPPTPYPVPVAYHVPVPTYAMPVVPVHAPLKSKTVAALLCFFLGGLGIHRFYTGQTGIGIALLLTTLILGTLTLGLWFVVTTIWVMIDFILILCGAVRDQYGREMTW